MSRSKLAATLLSLGAGALVGSCAGPKTEHVGSGAGTTLPQSPVAADHARSLAKCRMSPARLVMQLPDRGFTWLPGESHRGVCDVTPPRGWAPRPDSLGNLYVYADGPEGSGRYWTVVVGVSRRSSTGPIRGICLETSTVGWRTLQQFDRLPLPWLDDLDHDGNAELVIWESFPLRAEASEAEFGLVPWVYRRTTEDSLTIDWLLSRRMAREVAQAYRAPLAPPASGVQPLRTAAAEALEQFADERCQLESEAR